MPPAVIESLGFAVIAFWAIYALLEYRKAKRAMLPRRQIMARMGLLTRYLYGSLIVLGVLVVVWQSLAPGAHPPASGR